jgi:hypothetical protein
MTELEIDRLRRELAMRNAELEAYKEYARRINAMQPPEPIRLTTLTEDIIAKAVEESEQRGYRRGLEDAAQIAFALGLNNMELRIRALMDTPQEEQTDDNSSS